VRAALVVALALEQILVVATLQQVCEPCFAFKGALQGNSHAAVLSL
jgi:hypothetical protein